MNYNNSNNNNIKDFSESIKHGTTTLALVCNDGVIMGADMRASGGTYIFSAEAIKIYKIDDNLGMTIAGGVGDAEYLVKILKMQSEIYKMGEGKSMTPKSATSILSLIMQENKMMPYYVEILIGGLTKGMPEVYSIDPVGGYIKDSKFTSSGSGSIAATGYIESVYQEGMSTQDAAKHVAKALKIAMKRDSATGDGIRIVTITKRGYREYSKDEVERLLK
jgi:proteasome beta subunit